MRRTCIGRDALLVLITVVKICFLHCWLYHREAASLVAIYSNVFFDTGELNAHSALGYGRILAESLEVSPFEKILYSSDAFGPPELYFVAARRLGSALSSLLDQWQEGGCTHLSTRLSWPTFRSALPIAYLFRNSKLLRPLALKITPTLV